MKLQLMRFLSSQETPTSLDLTYNDEITEVGARKTTEVQNSNLLTQRVKKLILAKVKQDVIKMFENHGASQVLGTSLPEISPI